MPRPHHGRATLLQNGGGELRDVAGGLPMSVIGDIVGIPEADRPRIFALVDEVLALGKHGNPMPEGDALAPFMQVFEYATELTKSKRENPVDDIWSTLCHAEIEDDDGTTFQLPANELEIFFFILSLAGSDTTRNALCDGIRAFVANQDQIERYRGDPAVRRTAADEVIRYSTPIMFWVRGATKEVTLAKQTIERGARVVTMLRSANRDEDVFDEPMRFAIGRDPNPHVSSGGGGAHHCLGAMLARAEVRAALDELLQDPRHRGRCAARSVPEPGEQYDCVSLTSDTAHRTRLTYRNAIRPSATMIVPPKVSRSTMAEAGIGERWSSRRRIRCWRWRSRSFLPVRSPRCHQPRYRTGHPGHQARRLRRAGGALGRTI